MEVSTAPVNSNLHLTTTTSRASDIPARRQSTSADVPPSVPEHEMRVEDEPIMEDAAAGGEGHADEAMEEDSPEEEVQRKRVESTPSRQLGGPVAGPKKTRVIVRDAAWSTWWAVLYWVGCGLCFCIPTNRGSCTPISSSSLPSPLLSTTLQYHRPTLVQAASPPSRPPSRRTAANGSSNGRRNIS